MVLVCDKRNKSACWEGDVDEGGEDGEVCLGNQREDMKERGISAHVTELDEQPSGCVNWATMNVRGGSGGIRKVR